MKAIRVISWLGLLTVMGLLGCSKEKAPPSPELPAPAVDSEKATVSFATNAPELGSITVQAAQPQTLAVTHVTGRLYWDDDVTVRVFTPVAGRVIAIRADLGQAITNGSPLAEIDSPDFGQALATTRTAIANLAVVEKAYSRSQELLQHGAAAQKDVEAAQAAYLAAQAERDRAEAVLANYGGSVKNTNAIYILRSPIAGVLVDKNISSGQELRADLMLANAPNLFAPLFVVSDPTRLWLQIDVAESDLSSLQPGQHLQVASPAFPDKVFDGTVDNLGATLDPTTRTIKVRGVVNNPDKLLRAEMYVMVNVDSDKKTPMGVEVSSKALFMKGNDSYLFVEESPGVFQRKLVKVGVEQDGKVPVLEGVSAGEKVVTEGALLLQALIEP
jgi:cobalt-zinc-cadmium efflux system membrane fusion protein